MNKNKNNISNQIQEIMLNHVLDVVKDKKLISVIALAVVLRFVFSDDKKGDEINE